MATVRCVWGRRQLTNNPLDVDDRRCKNFSNWYPAADEMSQLIVLVTDLIESSSSRCCCFSSLFINISLNIQTERERENLH